MTRFNIRPKWERDDVVSQELDFNVPSTLVGSHQDNQILSYVNTRFEVPLICTTYSSDLQSKSKHKYTTKHTYKNIKHKFSKTQSFRYRPCQKKKKKKAH